jgi:DNA-binding NtrC family response regulator
MLPTLLIVDDEPRIFQALRRTLHREELELRHAASAEEAMLMLEAEPVDIVLADENMPGMNGSRLLGIVRQRWPDTIRMLLTGSADLKVVIDAVNHGHIAHFFTKPCDDAELIVTIREALSERDKGRTTMTLSPSRGPPTTTRTREPQEESMTTVTLGSRPKSPPVEADTPVISLDGLDGLDIDGGGDMDDLLHDLRRKLDDLAG